MYVVIRHYNKAIFSVKRIEYDGEFKSIMDEVINDMGMETNDENPDDHFTVADKKKRLIKERFQIAYYRLPYKNIPRIMIRHLAMNVTWNLNLFLAKVGV